MLSKDESIFLAHCETAAKWYMNTQCSDHRPWGGVKMSADNGRFLYEVYKGTNERRGAGNWAQALGILALLDLYKATNNKKYYYTAMDGARYLLSLQVLDSTNPACRGGMYEHIPEEGIGMSRDMATGCFGLIGLYKHTEESLYLDRAKLFCDWYIEHGTREDGWPWRYFDYRQGRGYSAVPGSTPDEAIAGRGHIDGDWQVGGGLCLYHTGKCSGDRRYLDEGFKPMVDALCDLYDKDDSDPDNISWHGSNPITMGNDDFALIALMSAFNEWQDDRYLSRIKERTRRHLDWMAEDGSYPNFGSTFVCGIEHVEYCKLAEKYGFSDMVDEVRASLEKTARFGLGLQERDSNDSLFYGGLYGQSSFGIERDRIHHRSTGYSINFYLKYLSLINHSVPWAVGFSSLGWD